MNQQINERVSHTLMWSNWLSAVRQCGESRRLVTRSQRRRWKRESEAERCRRRGTQVERQSHGGDGGVSEGGKQSDRHRARCKHIHHMLQIISLCCCHNWLIDWPTGWLTGWLAATLARWLYWLPGRLGGWLSYCFSPIISWWLKTVLPRWLIHGQNDWATS